ncbi:MAG: sulfite exporter TauE/SafE family protein [Anaerolineae bacterium]|nr:sulfite exporter TauE/SafE family protein [Anaerolineae bacterium]
MAYGVSSNAFLLSLGISPAAASMSVHTAEVFVTLISGLSHLKLGNVDLKMFKKLVIPGVVGGIVGAYILTAVPGDVIKPFISAYLLLMGLIILYKVFAKKLQEKNVESYLIPLAAVGGFFDAIGGGGWGPIVTTTIVARGHNPRLTIGSVNLSEFFVTLAQVITFVLTLGSVNWLPVIGLLIGGVIAAPMAAFICKRIPARVLMFIVGILIIVLSIRTIYQTL